MNLTKRNISHDVKKGISLTALAIAVAAASGCSDSDDPDAGTSNANTQAVSGTVVDAYLAGATIYLDGNNNGKRDAWEASAITDKDGFFSTSAAGVDYCASDATSAQARYCLSTAATGNGTLRAYGGFDIFTGEPFVGSLAANVSLSGGTVANQVISPLTSVLTEAGDDAEQVLSQLGITEEEANSDFLGTANSAAFDAALTNQALKLHKIVQLFEDVFDDHFEAFGELSNFPQRASVLIYEQLADQISSGNSLNEQSLRAAFEGVNSAVSNLYVALDDEDENFPGNAPEGDAVTNAVQILGLIDGALPSNTADLSEARARMVGVDVVVNKMNEDASDAIAAINQVGNLASDLYTSLNGAEDIDFTSLLDLDFSSTTDFSSAVIGSGGDTFDALDGKELFVDYSDDEDFSGKALLLFSADESGQAGTLDLCLSYDDHDTPEGDEDIYETDGTLIELATWFTIDERRLVLTAAGAFDITLISRGELDGENLYSLSYGGETASWSSPDGLIDLQTSSNARPTDDASCEALLNTL